MRTPVNEMYQIMERILRGKEQINIGEYVFTYYDKVPRIIGWLDPVGPKPIYKMILNIHKDEVLYEHKDYQEDWEERVKRVYERLKRRDEAQRKAANNAGVSPG